MVVKKLGIRCIAWLETGVWEDTNGTKVIVASH